MTTKTKESTENNTHIPDHECILSILRTDFSALWSAKKTGKTGEVVTPYVMPNSKLFTLFLTERDGRFIATEGGVLWEMIDDSGGPVDDMREELRNIATAHGMKTGDKDGNPIFYKDCTQPKLISSIAFDVIAFATTAAAKLLS